MKKNSLWPAQTTAGAVVTLVIAGVAALATPAIETSMMAAMAMLNIPILYFIIIHLPSVSGFYLPCARICIHTDGMHANGLQAY
jgi:hypothetical protein